VVLGTAQDAGYPAAGCHRECCARAWSEWSRSRRVSCLGLVDPSSGERWLLDCTPDFPAQLRALDQMAPVSEKPGLSGILLTHAHIGHYTGLIHLGREAIGAHGTSVFAMPRMRQFLATNEPWNQLIEGQYVVLQDLVDGQHLQLNERLGIIPRQVPHRDELSETVGYILEGPHHSALYLPDIDKWELREQTIEELIAQVDAAWLDGTFFSAAELGGRDMREIPHPLIEESIERFSSLPEVERGKIRFTHFNHTNPVLDAMSEAARLVRGRGYQLASEGEVFQL